MEICLDTFEFCPIDRATISSAATLPGSHFEDNVLIACALSANLDAIVTRNKVDFQTTSIAILEPAELLSQLPQAPTGATGPQTPQS